MNVLIRGANFTNKGAEAMALCVKYNILKKFPNSKIYLNTFQGYKEHCEANNFIPVEITKLSLILRILLIFIEKFFFIKNLRLKYMVRKQIKCISLTPIDVVIDISGFAYGDAWSQNQTLTTLFWMELLPNNPRYFFLPQSWGSFDNISIKEGVIKMLKNATEFWARDNISKYYLEEFINTEVNIAPDIVFACDYGNNQIGQDILLNDFQLDEALMGKFIIMSPNMRIYERMQGEGSNNEYVKILIKIITKFTSAGNSILLLSNEYKTNISYYSDDRNICDLLHNQCEKTYFCSKYYNVDEIQSIISQAAFVVASRYHVAILAIKKGIPVFSLSWSHKYTELMKLFAIDNYVIDPINSKTINADDRIYSAYVQRKLIKNCINANLSNVIERSNSIWNHIK